MRFLIDEDLPRSTKALFRQHGHEAVDVRDVGLRGAKDPQIASYAQQNGLCLVTGDFDFSDIRNYPPDQYGGIVVLSIAPEVTADFILRLVKQLLEQPAVLTDLSRKLAIVEPGRIRLRLPQ